MVTLQLTMNRSLSFLIAFLAFTTTPLWTQEKGWEMFDSSKPAQTPQESNQQAVYKVLLKLIDQEALRLGKSGHWTNFRAT
jgi:hypothetical protein